MGSTIPLTHHLIFVGVIGIHDPLRPSYNQSRVARRPRPSISGLKIGYRSLLPLPTLPIGSAPRPLLARIQQRVPPIQTPLFLLLGGRTLPLYLGHLSM